MVRTETATLVTDSGSAAARPGSVVYVPSREKRQWTYVSEDLTLIVIFAPPYKSREPAWYRDES